MIESTLKVDCQTYLVLPLLISTSCESFKVSYEMFLQSNSIPSLRQNTPNLFQKTLCSATKHDSKHAKSWLSNIFCFAIVSVPVVSHSSVSYKMFLQSIPIPFFPTKYPQFVSQRCKLTVRLLNMIASTLIADCQTHFLFHFIITGCISFFSFLKKCFLQKYSNSFSQTKYSQFVGTKLRTSFHFSTALHDNTHIDNFERYHEIIKCKSWHWKL